LSGPTQPRKKEKINPVSTVLVLQEAAVSLMVQLLWTWRQEEDNLRGWHTACLHTDIKTRGVAHGALRTEAAFYQFRGVLLGRAGGQRYPQKQRRGE
jgi:hypothetical protein